MCIEREKWEKKEVILSRKSFVAPKSTTTGINPHTQGAPGKKYLFAT